MQSPLLRQNLRTSEQNRLVYDLRHAGVAEVPMLGRYRNARALEGLLPHQHPGAIEICYLARGRQLYMTEGREYLLGSGDVFVTQPGESHGTGTMPQEKGVLYWIILTLPPPGGTFLLCQREEATLLAKRLSQLPRAFHAGAGMQRDFELLFLECQKPSQGGLDRPRLANRVLALILALLETRAGKERLSARMEQVLRTIGQEVNEPLSLARLAEESGLSLSRFKMRFKKEVGIPPAEYILRRKVEKAHEWLCSFPKRSVTEIAFELGFSSSQYFATVFRRYTGRSPSATRREANADHPPTSSQDASS